MVVLRSPADTGWIVALLWAKPSAGSAAWGARMNIYHYIVIGLFLAFAVADHFGRRHDFPSVRYWRVMGVISFLLYFTIGTFRNPREWEGENGFHAGSTHQIPEMLIFRKIS